MNKSTNYILALLLVVLGNFSLRAQQFYFSTERPTSCAATDGIATIVPMRGVPPFSYQWSTGSTELSAKNLPKGVYSATMTDATGATVSHTLYLNSKELDIDLLLSYPSGGCVANSGRLEITADAGTAPYTYTWSNGQTGTTASGLATGVYKVTIQDATGCTAENEYEVKPLGFSYFPWGNTSIEQHPDCNNPSGGELNAQMLYTNYFPISYNWNTGATTQNINNLNSGNYSVTMTDALGCTASASYVLVNKLDVTGNVICAGGNSGTLDATLINATGPVSYVWSNGMSGTHLSGLANGAYTVTATDAAGCTSVNIGVVVAPTLQLYDNSPNCYSGNNGQATVYVYNDSGNSYTWDNGETSAWASNLSPGNHTVTVSTGLGCTLTGLVQVQPPLGPAIVINATTTPADCSNSQGGSIALSAQGGIGSIGFNIYGPNGFISSDPGSLNNIQAGEYYISAHTTNFWCYASSTVHVPDAGGFEPELTTTKIDCSTGYGSAGIIGVTTPGAQFNWSNGSSAQALFNLTAGCYTITVTAGAACSRFFDFCLYSEDDSLNMTGCNAVVMGKMIHDQGVPGCNGTLGIPYQVIRTQPSGALNVTDGNGNYRIGLPAGTFDLEASQYDPADIACPAGAKHTVTTVLGSLTTGLDFHFLGTGGTDHRVRQRALRTAQPGYPYSLRLEVCNDGTSSNAGVLDFDYGNFLGVVSGRHFPQHAGAFALNNETSGFPNNNAVFLFPAITPGTCELLQLDLATPVTTPVNTTFITDASVTPTSGDPTPANNRSVLYNTVVGSFDPNCVLAYPARNGNPRDGGDILLYQDKTIVYQIFFQNTGNAPADQIIVRDPLDEHLDVASIRNIQSTHDMKVTIDETDKMLKFQFDNINLPDSTSDYAGSIGSIQYEIDLKPGVSVGDLIQKQVGIYFDFNAPVITNQNNLQVISASQVSQAASGNNITVFPNPAGDYFGFYCPEPAVMSLYDAMGKLVSSQSFETGLQRIVTSELPSGVYLIQTDSNGHIRNGKVLVKH